jgi:hypothetical protein
MGGTPARSAGCMDDHANRTDRQPSMGREYPQEQSPVLANRPAPADIVSHRLANVDRYW